LGEVFAEHGFSVVYRLIYVSFTPNAKGEKMFSSVIPAHAGIQ
jgi:hypothetical protein